MPATVYLVTGGARSGKSNYAQLLCEQLSATPIYLATAVVASTPTGGGGNDDVDDDDDDDHDDDVNDPLMEDEDFSQRIAKHQQDRRNRPNGCSWTTIEEPLRPSKHADKFSGQVVLVDCMTLWLTNWMLEEKAFTIGNVESTKTSKVSTHANANRHRETSAAVDRALEHMQREFEIMIRPYNVTFVFVTNEVGSGTHAESHVARLFVDAQGGCNQFVARHAQQVIHMVCGIPHILKNNLDEVGCTKNARKGENSRIVMAQRLNHHLSTRGMPMDERGYFLIRVDLSEKVIVAAFHSCIKNDQGEICDLDGNRIACHGPAPEPMKTWKCRTAKELTTEIFERWDLLSQLEVSAAHAAYIGREAQKAECSIYHEDYPKYQQD